MQTKQVERHVEVSKGVVEMADAHCHLDLMSDWSLVTDSINSGVSTIITDSVDTKSAMRVFEMMDNRHVFGAVGIDPGHVMAMDDASIDAELDFIAKMIVQRAREVVAIGEIGLDYRISGTTSGIARQKKVFGRLLDIAAELRLPASIHAREAIGDVLKIIDDRGFSRAHLHFFEGDEKEAKLAERLGCTVSVPPVESGRRKRVIKAFPIEGIMAESDSPVVGESPKSVEVSIRMVAQAKGISFESAAEKLTDNVKRFFSIHSKSYSAGLMRY